MNERNLGLDGNHNRVLELAKGEYVKVLHGDDQIAPDAIVREAAVLEGHPEVVLVTSKRSIIDDEGRRLLGRGAPWREGVVDKHDAIRDVVRAGRNLFGEPSAHLFRRQAAIDAGGFCRGRAFIIDVEFCLRLLQRGDLYYFRDELASFRVTAGQQSATLSRTQSRDLQRLLMDVGEEHDLHLSEADVARGLRVARRDAALRRILYGLLSVPARGRERIAYLIGGAWNTLFGLVAFALLWMLLSKTWPYWGILAIVHAISVTNAFFVQRQLVFRSRGLMLVEFGRFCLVYGAIAMLNVLVFPVLVRGLNLNPYLSQAAFTVFVVVVGYLSNKHFSFREPPLAARAVDSVDRTE